MLDLSGILIEFRDDTISIINCLKSEDYDALEGLLNERQALIDKLDNSDYDKKQFKELCEKYEILSLNSKMNDIMTEKRNFIRSEIKKIELGKRVNNNYNVNISVDSIFFNKKM